MTTIIVKPAGESSKMRRYRQRGEHMRAMAAQCASDRQLARRIDRAYDRLATGCSERITRAISLPSLREKVIPGACVLPGVAIYNAGHRNNRKTPLTSLNKPRIN